MTWEAPEARYRWLGASITVAEGVTWRVVSDRCDGATTNLSARVWATFPSGLRARILEGAFTYLLGGVEKDREHARTELRYLKGVIEQGR